MSSEVEAHIIRKYDIQTQLGKGAYGIVWRAIDRKTKQVVALKKIFDAFQNNTDAQRTFREIMFLQAVKHDNIIKLLNVHRADNDKDIYLVFEYMDTDLHAVIRAKILEDVHKQYIIYQLLRTLKYLHSAEILHRDMKPSNLLLNSDCLMKVADFGLARSILSLSTEQSAKPVLTDYIATRWYRAPEILLGSTKYTKGVDMWSVGCILGELMLEKPIFPGQSTMNQLERITAVCGKPSKEDIAAMSSNYAEQMLEHAGRVAPKSLAELCPKAAPEALDLMRGLLQINPHKRFTAEQALAHPYVASFHNPGDEPVARGPITVSLPDDTRFTVTEYRDRLYNEIVARKRNEKKSADATLLPRVHSTTTTATAVSGTGAPRAAAPAGAAVTGTGAASSGVRPGSSSYGVRPAASGVAGTRTVGAAAPSAAGPPRVASTVTGASRPVASAGVARPVGASGVVRPGSSATGAVSSPPPSAGLPGASGSAGAGVASAGGSGTAGSAAYGAAGYRVGSAYAPRRTSATGTTVAYRPAAATAATPTATAAAGTGSGVRPASRK
jgi:mitogen-activated protein kinase 15